MREIVDGYLVNDDNVKIAFTNRNVDAKSSEDMKRFSDNYGFNHDNIVYNTQVHGADVRIVESIDDFTENGKDKQQGVVALAHAGWRGTYGNIAGEMVDIMTDKYGCKVEDIKTIIGPSVSVDNYEVSYDLIEKFSVLEVPNYYKEVDGKYYLDLWKLNKELLKKCGILEDNIKIIDFCTVRDNDKFFSYRLDNATPKRIGTIIQLD